MPNPPFPRELLDYILDLLHDTRDALESCCLVSKSWVPRARKHLFARVSIHTPARLQSWQDTFPDPSRSPASHAKYLLVEPQDVTAADGEEGGWIPTFSRVVHFQVEVRETSGSLISFAPFHGFSPALETLHIASTITPSSRIYDLILSFPLLRSIAVTAYRESIENAKIFDDRPLAPLRPRSLNLPAFTGLLELSTEMGIGPIALRLLSLSGCLRFQKLCLVLHYRGDISLAGALVESCSDTLESLYLKLAPNYRRLTGSIDLSKATKLKDVTFASELGPKWIVLSLKTITSHHRNLQISVHTTAMHHNTDSIRTEWLELDSVLIKLWESHPVRLKAWHYFSFLAGKARETMENLFPEATKRGMVDLFMRGFPGGPGGGYL